MAGTEQWREIPGFPGYEASDLGGVRSLRRGAPRVLKTCPNPAGYPTVDPFVGGRNRTKPVHRLVLLAFVGPLPDGLVTRHLDGDPTNNALTNLRYGTVAENQQDAVRHGTQRNTRKVECPRGHPYDDENTSRRSNGDRHCRECTRIRSREWRAKQWRAA